MRWHTAAWSAGSIALAGLVWWYSSYPLDWIGLADFDPLDRICLVFVILSLTESAASRWTKH
jgi:hypothetical protein